MAHSNEPRVDMLRVLLNIEQRTIPPMESHLLQAVAGACQTIGSKIATSLEGEQRIMFQDLCAHVSEIRADQLLPGFHSDSAWFDTKGLIIPLVGLGLVSRRLIRKYYRYRRRGGTHIRTLSSQDVYSRTRHAQRFAQEQSQYLKIRTGPEDQIAMMNRQHSTAAAGPEKVLTGLPTVNSTTKHSGKDIDLHDPSSYLFLQLNPVFAPPSLADLRSMEPLIRSEKDGSERDGSERDGSERDGSERDGPEWNSSEWDGATMINSDNAPSTAKRKVAPTDDEESLPAPKKVKSGVSLEELTRVSYSSG